MKFALIGHPVAHSLSPVIHRAAYEALGESHDYGLIDAASEAELVAALERVRAGELQGVNVTIPWKRQAFVRCDMASPQTEYLQVANVVQLVSGKLLAHNTDVLALEREFKRLVQGKRAIVIGSGGAVPAVVAACKAADIDEVYVTARRFVEGTPRGEWPGASELERLGARPLLWPAAGQARSAFTELLSGVSLVVQCTSAGMHGFDDGAPLADLVPWRALPQSALVYDLIYVPAETPLLRAAREAGLRTENGLNMLVGQAALAIELWLGKAPPLEPLRAAAERALAARRSA